MEVDGQEEAKITIQLLVPEPNDGIPTFREKLHRDLSRVIDKKWEYVKRRLEGTIDVGDEGPEFGFEIETRTGSESPQQSPRSSLSPVESSSDEEPDDLEDLDEDQLRALLQKLNDENRRLHAENKRIYDFGFEKLGDS